MKKRALSTFSKVMIIAIAAVSVLFLILSIMERNGIRLISGSSLIGGIVMLGMLMVWGIGSLARRRKKPMTKYLVILALGFVGTMVLSILGAYIAQYHSIFVPQKYATLTLNDKTYILLYQPDIGLDGDEDGAQRRVEERAAERGEPPFSDDEEIEKQIERSQGDYGYAYTAAPRWMYLFVNMNQALEGTIYRGQESQAKILNDGVSSIYLENAEPGDEGELRLTGSH